MKNNKGITLTSLVITIIVLTIIAVIIVNVSTESIRKAKLEDLKTNMLLIQAKAKTYCEEVTFQTANLDSSKEEDLTKIQEIRNAQLKGTLLDNCTDTIKQAAQSALITDFTDYYYLNSDDLKQMGVNIDVSSDEYYLVKYVSSDLEVVYTKGFLASDGNLYYKLSEINNLSE